MPLIKSSDQKGKTFEEHYQELLSDDNTIVYNEIGRTMLSFLTMINETFTDTILYGVTSHDAIVIQRADDWEDGWFVSVYTSGDKKFHFEYKVPKTKLPFDWNNAFAKGQANTIEEAKNTLIIAMVESEGWNDNKELRKLYNKLKDRKTENPKFSLWLEFEAVDPENWNIGNDFCNIHVDLEDGRHYGLTVWTYDYFKTAINNDKVSGQNLNGLYQKPPDLFVKELTRTCIQQTIEDLLKKDDLEKVLNPSILQ